MSNDLFLALDSIGLSDERCCQILAWFSVYGMYTEDVVVDRKLNQDIRVATERLQIIPGKIPNYELVKKMHLFVKELKSGKKPKWCDLPTINQ